MHPRYLHLGLLGAIILAYGPFIFAQSTTGSFVSFTQPAGATNKPTLSLTLFQALGCSNINAVAFDRLGQPYITGWTTGCDNGGLFIASPNYLYMTRIIEGGGASGSAIAVDDAGNAYVTGDNPINTGAGIEAVNAIPECQTEDLYGDGPRLLDPVFLIKLDPSGNAIYSRCVPTRPGASGGAGSVDKEVGAYVKGNTGHITEIYSTPAVVYPTGPVPKSPQNDRAVDAAGSVYTTSESSDVEGEGVTTKTSPSGTLIYSAPIGGFAIAIDGHGGAYVTGSKHSVVQLSRTGSVVYQMDITLDRGEQQSSSIGVDSLGTVYLLGNTDSSTFPTTDGSVCASIDWPQFCLGGSGFIGKIEPYTTASVSPKSANLGAQLLSTTSTPIKIALSNTGTAQMTVSGLRVSGDYSVQTNYCRNGIKPSTHCDVYVVFIPRAGGIRTGTLTFTDNATSSPQVVALTGTGTTVSGSLLPASLAFPVQLINATSPVKSLTLTNKATVTVGINSIATSGDFIVASRTCGTTLGAGASCTINVAFKPTAIGPRTGALNATYSAGSSSKVVLSGISTMVRVAPTSLTFSAQTVGTTSLAKVVTLTNKGSSILTISSITKTGDFIILSKRCGISLGAGASCTVNVGFKPTATGDRAGSLNVDHNGGASPAKVSLVGTGI
jgi:hypothetical protein